MIYVIGIGLDGIAGLAPRALKLLEGAGLIAGGARHLEEAKAFTAKKITVKGSLEKFARAARRHLSKHPGGNVAVLATGDPLLYGIGEFMLRRFDKKRVRIIPAVSVVQEAFAKIKEGYAGARVFSVHGKTANLPALAKEVNGLEKAAVFTDPINTPAKVAAALIMAGVDGFTAYVCESLGYENEKITKGALSSVAKRKNFAPLNVLLLIRSTKPEIKPAWPPLGIPDALFSRSNGLITKAEVRAVSLAKLQLAHDSVVWDIGAGSGSVAIEAARLSPAGFVYAVEKEAGRTKDIEKNIKRFGVKNVAVVKGTAPECLRGLRPPDAVFVGGGGFGIADILKAVSRPLKKTGRIVVNAVTVETIGRATGYFKDNGWEHETLLMSTAKSKAVAGLSLLSANNPVFIITGSKP